MTSVRVAVAQLDLPVDDALTRRSILRTAISDAADQGADLIVLPELAATGYLLEPDHLHANAEPGDGTGPVLSEWAAAARDHGLAVVGGYAERGAGARLYNSAVLIDPDGHQVLNYRKLHLFAAEHDVFAPGDRGLPVAHLGDLTVGVAVCYDLRFPEAWRILAGQGADLVAVPTAWIAGFDSPDRDPARPIAHVEGALVLANLNQVAVACADQVGTSGPHHFLGRSLVIDPYGNPLIGPLDADTPDLALVDVDLEAVRASRDRGPGISPRANRRTDVYADLLGYTPTQTQPPGAGPS